MIFFDNFCRTRHPVVHEFRRDVGPVLDEIMIVTVLDCSRMSRAIESCIARIVHVRVELSSAIKKPVMLGAMGRCAEVKALRSYRFLEFSQQIAFGTHLAGAPVGDV